MTATVYQTLGGSYKQGQTSSDYSATWPYVIWDATDDADAIDALRAAAPTTYDGLAALDYEVEPTDREGLWMGRVSYGKRRVDPPTVVLPDDNYLYAFDTGSSTVNVKNSLAKIASYPSGAAPDVGLAIGVTREGVEGVDVLAPQYTYEITKGFAAAAVDSTYRGTLTTLTGKINDATFDGYDAGEVQFLGARGARRGTGTDDGWEVTFRFAVSKNVTGKTVKLWNKATETFADQTINVKGWEHLWLYSELCKVPFGADTRLEMRPTFAYIDQVFASASFTALGL